MTTNNMRDEMAKAYEAAKSISPYNDALDSHRQREAERASRELDLSRSLSIEAHGSKEQERLRAEAKPILQMQGSDGTMTIAIARVLHEIKQSGLSNAVVPTRKRGGLLGLVDRVVHGKKKETTAIERLENVAEFLDRAGSAMQQMASSMEGRVSWFEKKAADLALLTPALYQRAAELELRRNAELDRLKALQEEAKTSKVPMDVELREQEALITALSTRVLDLTESAITSYLMRGVMTHARRAAQMTHSNLMRTSRGTLPKAQLTLTAIRNQQEILDADEQSMALETIDIALTGTLGTNIRRTNVALNRALDNRRDKAETLRVLAEIVETELKGLEEMDTRFLESYKTIVETYKELAPKGQLPALGEGGTKHP